MPVGWTGGWRRLGQTGHYETRFAQHLYLVRCISPFSLHMPCFFNITIYGALPYIFTCGSTKRTDYCHCRVSLQFVRRMRTGGGRGEQRQGHLIPFFTATTTFLFPLPHLISPRTRASLLHSTLPSLPSTRKNKRTQHAHHACLILLFACVCCVAWCTRAWQQQWRVVYLAVQATSLFYSFSVSILFCFCHEFCACCGHFWAVGGGTCHRFSPLPLGLPAFIYLPRLWYMLPSCFSGDQAWLDGQAGTDWLGYANPHYHGMTWGGWMTDIVCVVSVDGQGQGWDRPVVVVVRFPDLNIAHHTAS